MISKLKEWFNHLIIPRPELSNMPICPFAKAVVANQEYTVEETNLDDIHFKSVMQTFKFIKFVFST